MSDEPPTTLPLRPFARLKFVPDDGIDPELVRLAQDELASKPATATNIHRLDFEHGERILVEDRGDHARVWQPTADMLPSVGPLDVVSEAADAFAATLAKYSDVDTRALVSLMRDAASIYVTESIREAACPEGAIDVPTHYVRGLAKDAARLRVKLGGGPLTEMVPRDAAELTCVWLMNLLIRPRLLDEGEPNDCSRCRGVTSPMRWAYVPFRSQGKAGPRLCSDCAYDVPLIITQEMFSKLPFGNPAITSLFPRLSAIEIKEHFRSNFTGVVASIQTGLERERLLVEPNIKPAALHRTYEIAEHYAHVPREQALLHLGVRQGAISALLRSWDRYVENRRVRHAEQSAKRE